MYNRYIRNDQGTYTRIPEEEPQRRERPQGAPSPGAPPPSGPAGAGPHQPPHSAHTAPEDERRPFGPPPPPPRGAAGRFTDGLSGFLRHILDQFHLDSVDTGDLLLLGLLFFLFREDADEELLVALGLLLIL